MSDKSLFNGGARPVLDLATTTPHGRVTSKAENEEIYANLKQANDQRHSKRISFSSDEDGSDSPRRYRPTLGFREQRSLPTLIACSLLFIGILRLAKAIVTLLQGRNAEDMADRTELCIRAVSDCISLPIAGLLILTSLFTFFSQGKSNRTTLVIFTQIFATLVILLQCLLFAMLAYADIEFSEEDNRDGTGYLVMRNLTSRLSSIFLVSTVFWLFPPPSRLIAFQQDHWHRTMHYILAITMIHAVLQTATEAWQRTQWHHHGSSWSSFSFFVSLSTLIIPATLCLATVWSYMARQTESKQVKKGLHIATLTALWVSLLFVVAAILHRSWQMQDRHRRRPYTTLRLLQHVFFFAGQTLTFLSYIALGYYCSPCRQMAGELPKRRENVNIREERMMVVV